MTQTQAQLTPRKQRRAPVFKSDLSRLRYAVRAATIELGMTEDEYRDLLERETGLYRYARLCTEQQLEAVLSVLEARKPTAPDYSDAELEAHCLMLLEVA